MLDFASKPGLLFVVATLLPLASFVLILVAFAIRTALRSSPEGSIGQQLYQASGGDVPSRWPAWLATAAIGLAFVCSATGFVWFLDDHKQIESLEEEARHGKASDRELAHEKLKELEAHWVGSIDWVRLGASDDPRQGLALQLGFRIDHLSAIMFLMVTLVATLIHLFSLGYMAEEKQLHVEDHQVHGEEGHYRRRGRFGRFFLFLSLFCFSMLNLVLADNLFQVFVSWELVGICSYLLIGFYFERSSASNAANKAFITNRIGDAGFVIGLMIVWTYFGTFNFQELFSRVRAPVQDSHGEKLDLAAQIVRGNVTGEGKGKKIIFDPQGPEVLLFPRQRGHFHAEWITPGGDQDVRDDPKERQFGHMPYWLLVAAGLGIFLGCVGKSAQFPLHVWLPDAMEGPTPVSALIHAATMVAAGVYLVGRCFPLFTAEVLLVIAYTGGITLFVAATIAVVMRDIKRVLAYSTVSQLGYMMLALGVGGWVAGLFHLLTHAFFKALLFLGSGAVIYGCHHEQDLLKMGGLYPKMKITALTMLMAVLAISGIPGFSGWYSKDVIVAQAMGFASVHPEHVLLFLLPLVTAGLTTFYMFRMWLLAFAGEPRDHHVYEHAHEAPGIMTGPLVVLAVFSVGVAWGWPFFSSAFPFIDSESSWLEHQLHHAQPDAVQASFGLNKAEWEAARDGRLSGQYFGKPPIGPELAELEKQKKERYWAEEYSHLAGNLALGVVIIGLVFAFALYYYRVLDPAEGEAQFPGIARFLTHKWYFDELYSALIVQPALLVSDWCKNIDTRCIDWLIDNSAAITVRVAEKDGRFDNRVIDGMVNLFATVAYGVGNWFRRWQTGYLRSYVLFLVLAAVGIFVILSYFINATG
ncbi:MAG: NADH-quinone oxidoreductase subunit L [Planctomycetes bacterium]|nr:NADH-quinone oxidoreductase subunit L [Planctomycetota bacterium]